MEFVASHYFPQFERFLAVGLPASGCMVGFGLGTVSPLPARAVVPGAGVSELHGLWLRRTRNVLPQAGAPRGGAPVLAQPHEQAAATAFALLWVCCTKVVSHCSIER